MIERYFAWTAVEFTPTENVDKSNGMGWPLGSLNLMSDSSDNVSGYSLARSRGATHTYVRVCTSSRHAIFQWKRTHFEESARPIPFDPSIHSEGSWNVWFEVQLSFRAEVPRVGWCEWCTCSGDKWLEKLLTFGFLNWERKRAGGRRIGEIRSLRFFCFPVLRFCFVRDRKSGG